MSDNRWLVEWPVRLTPMADLLCCPGAGAGASAFRDWPALLPGYAAVLGCQLPGRERRIDEPPVASLVDAAAALADAYLAARAEARPLVLFGHSMGAALAVETAARLAERGRGVAALVLAASTPPEGRGGPAPDEQGLHDLLLRYDPANARIAGHGELFDALAPVLAGDIGMLRRHVVRARRPEPAHLLGGSGDEIVPPAAVARWAAHFSGPVEHHTIGGGHFFPFREGRDAVIALLARLLRQAASG